MKTHLKLIVLLASVLPFTTCKKQREEWFYTKVSGTVTNEVDNKPMSNVKFYINEGTYSDRLGKSVYKNIDSVFTDNEGKYNYKFKANYESDYSIEIASKLDSLQCSALSNSNGWISRHISKGHVNKFDNLFTYYAIAKIVFKRNTGNFLVDDEFTIKENYNNTSETINLYIQNPIIFGLGGVFKGMSDSQKKVKFEWTLKLNGIEQKDSVELLIKKCDYIIKEYEI